MLSDTHTFASTLQNPRPRTPAANPAAAAPSPTTLATAAFDVVVGAPVPVALADALAALLPLSNDVAVEVAEANPDDVAAAVGTLEMVMPACWQSSRMAGASSR